MYANDTKRFVTFVAATARPPGTGPQGAALPLPPAGAQQQRHRRRARSGTARPTRALSEEASYGFNTNLNGIRITKVRKSSETVALCDAGLMDTAAARPVAGDPLLGAEPGVDQLVVPAEPSAAPEEDGRRRASSTGTPSACRWPTPFYPGADRDARAERRHRLETAPNYQDTLWDLGMTAPADRPARLAAAMTLEASAGACAESSAQWTSTPGRELAHAPDLRRARVLAAGGGADRRRRRGDAPTQAPGRRRSPPPLHSTRTDARRARREEGDRPRRRQPGRLPRRRPAAPAHRAVATRPARRRGWSTAIRTTAARRGARR